VDPALAAYQNRADLATLRKLLVHDWDRRMARDSSGALALHAFAHLLAAEVIEDDITSLVFERVLDAAPYYILKVAALALQGAYPEGAKILQGGRDAVILRALDNTARFLSARFGGVDPSRYRWADMHVSSFDDAYGVGVKLLQVPTDGGENTVNVSHSVFRTDLKIPSKWVSRYGPIARTVGGFDADGKPHVFVNFPLGNVADRASAHFADALDGWVEGRYRKMLFERAEIEAATERRIRLAR
jgi:penicillin amidase